MILVPIANSVVDHERERKVTREQAKNAGGARADGDSGAAK